MVIFVYSPLYLILTIYSINSYLFNYHLFYANKQALNRNNPVVYVSYFHLFARFNPSLVPLCIPQLQCMTE